eukprot:gene26378-32354_t
MNSDLVRSWSVGGTTANARNFDSTTLWRVEKPDSGVELDTTWRMLQAVGAAPRGMQEGILRQPNFLSDDDFANLTQIARRIRPSAVPIEGPYGQGRLWTRFPSFSPAVELLASEKTASRVSELVGEQVVSAHDEGLELRVYTPGSSMDWHTDELLYAAPQYELVLTLWNSSDSRTEWRDADGRIQ